MTWGIKQCYLHTGFSSAFHKVSPDSPNFSVWGMILTLWDCLPLSDFFLFSLLCHHTTMCSFMCWLCITAFPVCFYVVTQLYSIVVRSGECSCFMSLKKKVRKAHHIRLCLVSDTGIHREGTWVSLSSGRLYFISYLPDCVLSGLCNKTWIIIVPVDLKVFPETLDGTLYSQPMVNT